MNVGQWYVIRTVHCLSYCNCSMKWRCHGHLKVIHVTVKTVAPHLIGVEIQKITI